MVEKREEAVSQNILSDPTVDMLTINPNMKQQKLADLKDKVESQMNEAPLEVFVKDDKEAEAVTKLEAKYGDSVPLNADELLDNVDDIVKEAKQDTKQSVKEKASDLKQTKDNLVNQAKDISEKASNKMGEYKDIAADKMGDIKGAASEKIGEWKEDVKSGIDTAKKQASELSGQAKEQYQKLERNIRNQPWSQSPYMWLVLGAIVAGTSYVFYKSFM